MAKDYRSQHRLNLFSEPDKISLQQQRYTKYNDMGCITTSDKFHNVNDMGGIKAHKT